MMKRFLCILMCMMLIVPTALASTDTTPTKKFRQQVVTGGNGIRGTVNLSASGVAEWVEVLSPFAGATLQLRAIGEKQGDKNMSKLITDDDDWQVKLYAKDAQDEMRAVTYLYGGPEGLWLQSELMPEVLLTIPVKNVQLLYQLIDGETMNLLTAFDPLRLTSSQGASGNEQAYSAIAGLMQIDESEWTEQWEPVLAKYYTALDMWLSLYASEPVISGGAGSLTMSTSYTIPAEDLKAQAKYIIGMMVYDSELQNLLLPYVTMEQRMLYLNQSLVYFYEYCIDALPLSGNILLKREMTAKGETIGMSVSLPLTSLPEELTAPAGAMLAEILSLPYTDMLSNLERITFNQSGGDVSITVASPQRSISFILDETASNAETVHWEGFVRITPAVGSDEPPVSAAFTYKTSHKLWEDEEWVKHEDFTYLVSVEPDFSLSEADDPFRSSYVDFPPVSIDASFEYSLETDKSNRPVNLDVSIHAVLPDAEVGVQAALRTTNPWEHEVLPTNGGENLTKLSEARREELLELLTTNAVSIMTTLHAAPAEEAEEAGEVATPTEMPAEEPTAVPPLE